MKLNIFLYIILLLFCQLSSAMAEDDLVLQHQISSYKLVVKKIEPFYKEMTILEAVPPVIPDDPNVDIANSSIKKDGFNISVPIYFYEIVDSSGFNAKDIPTSFDARLLLDRKDEEFLYHLLDWDTFGNRNFEVGKIIPVMDSFYMDDKSDDIKRQKAINNGKRLLEKRDFPDYHEHVSIDEIGPIIIYVRDIIFYNIIRVSGVFPHDSTQ